MEGNAPPKKDGVFSVGEALSTRIMVVVPSALSLEQQPLVFPQEAIVHSALPLLEPKVSGCKPEGICASCRLPSPSGKQNPYEFSHPDVMVVSLPGPGALD